MLGIGVNLVTVGPHGAVINLLVNGSFDTDVSDWDSFSGGQLSWDSGTLKIEALSGDTFVGAQQGVTATSGKTYRISFEIIDVSGPNNGGWFRVGSSLNGSDLYSVDSLVIGSYSVDIVATTASLYLQPSLTTSDFSTDFIKYDNLVVEEL